MGVHCVYEVRDYWSEHIMIYFYTSQHNMEGSRPGGNDKEMEIGFLFFFLFFFFLYKYHHEVYALSI